MYKINLLEQSADHDTKISASGDVLTIDGEPFDFSELEEGEQVETSAPFHGLARRVDGVVFVSVLYKYDSATAEPLQSTDRADYQIELTDGEAPDIIKRRQAHVDPVADETED